MAPADGIRTGTFIVLTMLLASCAPTDLDLATGAAGNVLEAVRNGEYRRLDALYTADFYRVRTRPEWEYALRQVHDGLGPVQGSSLLGHSTEALAEGGSGIVLLYEVRHERASSRQTLKVRQEGGRWRVYEHGITSDAFETGEDG